MNRIRNIYKLMVFLIIIALNINTYAAIGANDGSAFVTKAEFDAVVNTFNEQMDTYENGIASKIDGAIANYLASLSNETTSTHTIGYFKTIPSNIESVKMQSYDAFPYVGGKPDVQFAGTFVSMPTGVYMIAAYGYMNYTGAENGARRFVTEDKTGGTSTYKWNGYSTNYEEKFSITCSYDGKWDNTGYSTPLYHYVYGTSLLNETSSIINPFWLGNFKMKIGPSGSSTAIPGVTGFTINTTWNDYTVGNKYDLIYEDYASANQKDYNLKCFVENNPNNRWFAGSGPTYYTVCNNSTRNGNAYMYMGQDQYNVINTITNLTSNMSSGYSGLKFLSCGFEPITSWSMVLCSDGGTYTDKAKTDGVTEVNGYSMIDGAVFGEVIKGGVYTWPVEFTDKSTDSTVWLKYGRFNGVPVSADCIDVSVDNGPIYQSATIKNGKGTIKFTAPSDGLVFFKWSKNKSINISKSNTYEQVVDK